MAPMIKPLFLVCWFLACMPLLYTVAQDKTVCSQMGITPKPGTPKHHATPKVAQQFRTHVECVVQDKQKTTMVHEYYDGTNNRGFINQRDDKVSYDAWFSYKTNEYITYFPKQGIVDTGSCKVVKLSNNENRALLGYQNINGQPHIYSAAGALHFSGLETYMGTALVRGIMTDWWRSCQYWSASKATMMVDYYFTNETTWQSASDTSIPVQAKITGDGNDDDGVFHNFTHVYNFFEFRPQPDTITDTHFETPAGVVCPGRQLTKKFPPVPQDAFSFTTEILDDAHDSITFMVEHFDYINKLVKYEYRPTPGDAHYNAFGNNDLVEVHDFHSGVAYITDKHRGNCTAQKIELTDFDDKMVGFHDVRIRTSKEFFYFDNVKNLSYEGVKKNRNIDCDSWIATRNDFPTTFPVHSKWEWYFAANTWKEVNAGPENGAIPIQMRLTIPSYNLMHQYNMYNFKKSKSHLLNFDVSGCYEFLKRRNFQFMLPGSIKSQVSNNLELLKYYILIAIKTATTVTPIRVAHLNVFFDDNIVVSFELLDVSPIVGDIQRSPDYKEVSLDFAADVITQMITNRKFVVIFGGEFGNLRSVVANPDIIDTTFADGNASSTGSWTIVKHNTFPGAQTTTGYAAGPMAAVGVTMPILGGALGVVFAYFFFR